MKHIFSGSTLSLFFFTLITFAPTSLWGQFAFQQRNDITVWEYQNLLDNPWAGGMNSCQFSAIDLNFDGIEDLIVFDRTGNRILPFLHSGSPVTLDFTYAPQYIDDFPALHDWVLMADYNLDGLTDIFTFHDGGIKVYKNISYQMDSLIFTPYPVARIQTKMGGSKSALTVLNRDIPALNDLDNDGDLDILLFDNAGSMLEYHQNLGFEMFTNPDSLVFELAEACWGHVMEDAVTNSMVLNVFCKNGSGSQAGNGQRLHPGSTLLAFDLDGDLDKELLVGDISFDNMVLLTNGGEPAHADITTQTNQFPPSNPANIPTFPAAFHLDIDHDGKKDLVISPNATDVSENTFSSWWYRNTGTDSLPVFSYFKDDLIQDEMIDLGSGAYPNLIDYDKDGKTDLVVSNHGFYDAGSFRAQIYLFRNSGSDTLPIFDLITDDMANLGGLGYQESIFPALGDLDDDGDLDMLVGKADGTLDYFENISLSPNDIFPTYMQSQVSYQSLDIGAYAMPQLVDIDGDTLLDLLIGEQAGTLNYYRNTGTAQAPTFTLETDHFGMIDVSQPGAGLGYSFPHLFVYLGKQHLLVGAESGHIYHFSDIEGNLNGTFTLQDSAFEGRREGRRAAPAIGNLNGDEWPDLVRGNFSGGLTLFIGMELQNVSISHTLEAHPAIDIFPNPARNHITVRLHEQIGPVDFRCLDVHGKTIISRTLNGPLTEIPVANLPKGLYFARFDTRDGKQQVQKLLLY